MPAILEVILGLEAVNIADLFNDSQAQAEGGAGVGAFAEALEKGFRGTVQRLAGISDEEFALPQGNVNAAIGKVVFDGIDQQVVEQHFRQGGVHGHGYFRQVGMDIQVLG